MTPPPATEPAALKPEEIAALKLARSRAYGLTDAVAAKLAGSQFWFRPLNTQMWVLGSSDTEIEYGDGYEYSADTNINPGPLHDWKRKARGWHDLQAKPAPDWREHDGGPCPVAAGALVQVKLRDGTITDTRRAELFEWPPFPTLPEYDIIAWRPAAPQPAEPPAKWQREKEHFEKGGKLEVKGTAGWTLFVGRDPDFVSDWWQWRIKPEAPAPQSRRVAWSFETRPMDMVWVYKKGFITDRLITAWKDDRVEIGEYAKPTYEELFRDWLQRDGSPCGTPCTREAAPEAS